MDQKFSIRLDLRLLDLKKCCKDEDRLIQYLEPYEIERAYRFKFDYLRQRYICSHAYLRFLLAQYLNVHPKDILFKYNASGKPYLAKHSLFFNMSHSEDMVLYGFSSEVELGVDIEYISPYTNIDQLPFFLFSKEAQKEIKTAPNNLQKKVFYTHWVKMEACLKARGIGLTNLPSINQSYEVKDAEWSCLKVDLPDNYIGAAAYKTSSAFEKILEEHPFTNTIEAINIDIPPKIIGVL